MKVLVRVVQHVYPDKWAELEEYEKEFAAFEATFGVTSKKRYRMLSGPDHMDTINIEYVADSLAAWEAVVEKMLADPKYQEFGPKANSIIKDSSFEIYWILPS